MDYNVPIGGFRLVSAVSLAALSATARRFRHEKTGAELLWLDRPSENKTFSIAFQTLPEDDTGVFHILEHSVLCGSEKYPVKEPFVELMKGSLNTFLNAMTFPDKTMYPIASRNDKDFRNLMRVYLDAVFSPNIYRNPSIFRQEGWRCELAEDGTANYVGVVFGEMKGALSSVDELLQLQLDRMLYPDTCYRFCYGGDPAHIPELTGEQFLANHRRFYHPSNAKLFLDGAVEITSILKEIDREYLSGYDYRAPDFSLSFQSPISGAVETIPYEIAPGEGTEGKAIFVMGKLAGTWENVERMLALEVLQDYLVSSNSAPLTQAILERSLGEDVQILINSETAQPYFALQVRNCREDALSGLRNAIQEILRALIRKGLDPEELAASLNQLEFRSRERREPFGVDLAIRACQSWMYGGDPTLYLDLSPAFAALRGRLGSSYFSDLLEELLLRPEGMAEIRAIPSPTLGEERRTAERTRLAAAAAAWSREEREAVIRTQQALAAWQQSPDTPEALASLPRLTPADLPAQPFWTTCARETRGKVQVLRPQVDTGGTAYLDLCFALPERTLEELSLLSLLPRLLGTLPTKHYSRQQLRRAIKTDLGNLTFSLVPIGRDADPDHAVCYLRCCCSVLENKVDRAVSLIREILLETEWNHPDRIKETVQQAHLAARQSLIASGHQYAFRRALAGLTAEGAAAEAVSGYRCCLCLRDLAEAFDFDRIQSVILPVMDCLPTLPLTVGAAGQVSPQALDVLCRGFGGEAAAPTVVQETVHTCRDAIAIPAGVAYAVQGGNLRRLGETHHGSYALAAKILSLNYLWNAVRVQGGAYGTGMAVRGGGDVFAYSFRDPNPARTLDIYQRAAAFLRRFCENREPFDQLLIGAVSDAEPLLSAEDESRLAVERSLRGITLEQKRRERRELLASSYQDLLRFCGLLEQMEKNVCVVGGSALLDTCAGTAPHRI